MNDTEPAIGYLERALVAPELVEKAAKEHDMEQLAEVCVEVQETVREESMKRDINRHGGIAALYLVIGNLAEGDND